MESQNPLIKLCINNVDELSGDFNHLNIYISFVPALRLKYQLNSQNQFYRQGTSIDHSEK